MTTIRYTNRPRWRQSEVMVRDRDIRLLIVALEPTALLLRRKGTRAVLRLPFSRAYIQAAYLEAARIKAERAEARKRKRNGGAA